MESLYVTENSLGLILGITSPPITVHQDMTVTYDKVTPAPTFLLETGTARELAAMAKDTGWELLSLYFSSNVLILTGEEFEGSRFARNILSTPGTYVARPVDVSNVEGDDYTRVGWVVGRRLENA